MRIPYLRDFLVWMIYRTPPVAVTHECARFSFTGRFVIRPEIRKMGARDCCFLSVITSLSNSLEIEAESVCRGSPAHMAIPSVIVPCNPYIQMVHSYRSQFLYAMALREEQQPRRPVPY